jgi:two-component system, LytTR family, response regulator
MKILIADDESPAREELQFMLKELLPQAELHQASDGNEALQRLSEEPFDVVFLDIQMPGKDGLEVATKLLERQDPPRIVFATAYSEHAVEAFRLSALDYIVKPIGEERLLQTLDKLKEDSDQRHGFQNLLWSRKENKLWAEATEDRWVLLNYHDIQYIQAQDKKVYAAVEGYPPLRIRRTLKELEDAMAPQEFLRVHKGYLVNLRKVKEMSAWFSGSYTLILDSAQKCQVPLSRRFVNQFREATGW